MAPELRDKIVQYQEDCDKVLWDYWAKDHRQYIAMLGERAARILPLPGVKCSARKGINFRQMLILQEQARGLEKLPNVALSNLERQGLYSRLRQVNGALSLPTPARARAGGDIAKLASQYSTVSISDTVAAQTPQL